MVGCRAATCGVPSTICRSADRIVATRRAAASVSKTNPFPRYAKDRPAAIIHRFIAFAKTLAIDNCVFFFTITRPKGELLPFLRRLACLTVKSSLFSLTIFPVVPYYAVNRFLLVPRRGRPGKTLLEIEDYERHVVDSGVRPGSP